MTQEELELEAEEYKQSTANKMAIEKSAFIAGATSKYVEKQKLEFAIEQLKSLGYLHNDDMKTIRQRNAIDYLQQKLSEL